MELESLITTVRRMSGSPDTTEMPDDDITGFALENALDWLNRRRPAEVIAYLTTAANQQDYDMPSAAYHVTDVWWLTADFEWFSPSMQFTPADLNLNSSMAGFDVLDNPALVDAFRKQITSYQLNFAGKGFEVSTGTGRKIRLAPAPGSAGDRVYYQYTKAQFSGLVSIPDVYVPGFRLKTSEFVLRALAAKRSRIRSGKNYQGDGGEGASSLADRYEEQAEGEIPIIASPFARG